MTFRVQNVDWGKAKHTLCGLREKVFVYEWRIPRECEFDQFDPCSYHVLVVNEEGQGIATGRLTPEGEIGRVAVESRYRRPAVYRALFRALLKTASHLGLEQVSVQCELEGVTYYQQKGFHPVGSVYMDAGIPRQRMSCRIDDFSLSRVELTH